MTTMTGSSEIKTAHCNDGVHAACDRGYWPWCACDCHKDDGGAGVREPRRPYDNGPMIAAAVALSIINNDEPVMDFSGDSGDSGGGGGGGE